MKGTNKEPVARFYEHSIKPPASINKKFLDWWQRRTYLHRLSQWVRRQVI